LKHVDSLNKYRGVQYSSTVNVKTILSTDW